MRERALSVLLVKSGGEAALPAWREAFAAAAPGLAVHWWDDPAIDPASVRYVLVWEPDAGRLASLPNLQVILSTGAGVDHITRDATWPVHVPLVRMGGAETGQRMGEYVALACLSALRGMRRIALAQEARRWDYFENPRCATDVRVGLMGLGNIGARAAAMLQGLGFAVSGWSRTRKALAGVDCYAGPAEQEAFLRGADILVCLLPDTPDTRGAIRADTIACLPAGAAVVNAARGSHVVFGDLVAALDAGRLSAAVLDVFTEEPLPPEHPAWVHPKILVTSHLGGIASRPARAEYAAEVIRRFEAGEKLPNLFDPARGY